MDRWIGKVAVVTGASAGIGAAICIDLAKAGLIVVGLARRIERIENLKHKIDGATGQIHSYYCDVANEDSVKDAFKWIDDKFGHVNILVNNAGLFMSTMILSNDSNSDYLKSSIDTNINGVLYCTKEAFKILQRTGEYGHIVNLGSIVSHSIPTQNFFKNGFNVYPCTKFAIKAITEVLRQELITLNQKVKVSMICPGLVETEIFEMGGHEGSDTLFKVANSLKSEDVSQACLYILGTPPHVQVHDLIIKPVGEPY